MVSDLTYLRLFSCLNFLGHYMPVKVMFDVFAETVPFVETQGVRVVEPEYLLSLYGNKHSSDLCFSVQIARKLLAQGINPIGRPEMADYRAFLSGSNR